MYAIKESKRALPDDSRVTTYSREVSGCNTLEVEAGTTGPMGGDSGHGCRTYFRIQDLGGSDLRIALLESAPGNANGFEVMLGGDSELATITKALEFITHVLNDQGDR